MPFCPNHRRQPEVPEQLNVWKRRRGRDRVLEQRVDLMHIAAGHAKGGVVPADRLGVRGIE